MAVGKLFWVQMVVFILLAAAPPKIVDGTRHTMCDAATNLGKTFFSLCIFIRQSFQSVNAPSRRGFSPNLTHGGGGLLSRCF